MKRILSLAMSMFLIVGCFAQAKDPPIGQELFVEYQNAKLVLGYPSLTQVQKMLGKPQKSEESIIETEGFDWGKITTLHYFDEKLILVFSQKNARLIQVSLQPAEGDQYNTAFGISEKSTRAEIRKYLVKEKFNLTEPANSRIIWVNYFSQSAPMLDVSCAIKFTETDRVGLVKYFFSAPWEY